MKEQKIMAQMKGQDKTPEKQLNEVKIGNLAEKEFKTIVKMIQDLRKTMKMQEMFTKDLQELINSRITKAEEWINGLEDRMVEITAVEQNIEKRMKKNEDSLTDLWDIKHINIHVIGVPEREEREKGPEKK